MSEVLKNDELKALILSNAKAIQTLTENGSEAKRERARLYQIMSDLAQSHADLAQADNQGLLYQFMEHSEEQQQKLIKIQADITEILKFLTINKG